MDITTKNAAQPIGQYPHAKRVGNLLFLSGIGPRTIDNNIPQLELDHNGRYINFNFEAQVHSVFANIKAILVASGSSMEQLVDVTVFLVNIERDFVLFNAIYAIYFPYNQPCRTTVEINKLPTPIAIELKCIATIDS